MKVRSLLTFMLISLFMSGLLISCASEEEDVSSGNSNFASSTADNMSAIYNDYVPNSMASGSSSSPALLSASIHADGSGAQASDDDVCGDSDLFECQPKLLKLYIQMSREVFLVTRQFLVEMGGHLGDLADGASGVVNTGDGMTVYYSKTSASEWDVVATTSVGTVFDVSVADNVYTLKMNENNNPDSSDTTEVHVVVNYTDASNWSVTTMFLGEECDPNDPQAPERVKLILAKENDVHTGKAMLYAPRWAHFNPEPTCSSSDNVYYSMNLYTDFVGNDTAAKVKVYMMKSDVTTDMSSTIGNYSMNKLCDSYYGNFGWSQANCKSNFNSYFGYDVEATLVNPFCTIGPDNATWGSDCSGTDDTVAGASFGSASDWVTPSAFYQQSISYRSDL